MSCVARAGNPASLTSGLNAGSETGSRNAGSPAESMGCDLKSLDAPHDVYCECVQIVFLKIVVFFASARDFRVRMGRIPRVIINEGIVAAQKTSSKPNDSRRSLAFLFLLCAPFLDASTTAIRGFQIEGMKVGRTAPPRDFPRGANIILFFQQLKEFFS